MVVQETAGNRIREWREIREMSGAALARKLGVGRWAINRLESGERRLTTQWIERISFVLCVAPQDLLRPGETPPADLPPEDFAQSDSERLLLRFWRTLSFSEKMEVITFMRRSGMHIPIDERVLRAKAKPRKKSRRSRVAVLAT